MRRALLAVLVFCLAVLAAACGGSGSSPATTAPATSPGASQPAGNPGTQTDAGSLAPIAVSAPTLDQVVTSPVKIAGTADVFEANLTVIIEDANGKELAKTFTTASCGTGCRGDYSVDVPFEVGARQPGTIVVHDDDAAGTGTPPHMVTIPVTLSP